MYGLDIQTARPFGRRRRDRQHGFVLLTPAVEAHVASTHGKRHPEAQRFECARHAQGGTVTAATAKRLYAHGSAQCNACCHRQQCSQQC